MNESTIERPADADPLIEHREAFARQLGRVAGSDAAHPWRSRLRRLLGLPVLLAALVATGAGIAIGGAVSTDREKLEEIVFEEAGPQGLEITRVIKPRCEAEAIWWEEQIVANGPEPIEWVPSERFPGTSVSPVAAAPKSLCEERER